MSIDVANVIEFTAPHSKVELVKQRMTNANGEFDFSKVINIPKSLSKSLPDWAEKAWDTRFNAFGTYYKDTIKLLEYSDEEDPEDIFQVTFRTYNTPPIKVVQEMSRIYGVRANLMWAGEDKSVLGEVQFDEKGNEIFSVNVNPESITAGILYDYIWDIDLEGTLNT